MASESEEPKKTEDVLKEQRETIDMVCEWGILGLVLVILVFGPLAVGAVRPLEFSIIQWLTVGVLALWAVRVWAGRHYRLFWPPVCWVVVAVAAYQVIRSLLTPMPHATTEEMNQVLAYAILFLAIVNNLNHRESAICVTTALVIVGVLISGFAFYQAASHNPHIWMFTKPPVYAGRGTGTYINPNHLAGYLEMVLPLTVAFTLMARFNHATKALFGYAAAVIAAGVGISFSRGGIVAAGVGMASLLIVLLFQQGYKLKAALLLVCMLIGGGIFASKLPQAEIRFKQTEVVRQNKQPYERILYWKAAYELYKTNIVWGIGSGHFTHEFWPHKPLETAYLDYAHNDYIQTLAEWGTVGFALIMAAVAMVFAGAKKTWHVIAPNSPQRNYQSTKAAFLVGGIAGLTAMLVHSFVDFNMHIPANAIVVVVLMALVTAHLRFTTDRFWLNPRIIGKIIFTLVAIAGIIYVGKAATLKYKAGIALHNAIYNARSFDERAALFKRAAALEPKNFETAFMLGDLYRRQGWDGKEGYKALLEEALKWYQRAMDLSPFDPASRVYYGKCLDWLDRHDEATPYFKKALELSPTDGYIAADEIWHYIQMEDYAQAKRVLEQYRPIYGILPLTQRIAYYESIINRKLAKQAREAAEKQKAE